MITKTKGPIPFIHNADELFESIYRDSPAWLQPLREQALNEITKTGLPTTRDEDWKYTSLAGLPNQLFMEQNRSSAEIPSDVKHWNPHHTLSLVFYDGIFCPEISNLDAIPDGVIVTPLKTMTHDHVEAATTIMNRFPASQSNAFANLNTATFRNGVLITLAPGILVKPFIYITHLMSSTPKALFTASRCLVHLGKSSQASIMESHRSVDDNTIYLNCPVTEIILEENACLHYVNSQHESSRASHIQNTRMWCERNSVLNALTVTSRGKLSRHNLDIILNGEGVDATLNGLYTPYGDQHVDHHTSVDHRFPNCVSNQLYKGILSERSRAVFNGKIMVHAIAQQTNSYQLNKNLLLGKDSRVDTKPQLEIFADDVKCTHGATIGQLDQTELFYLQTRGISKATASQILAHGFADEIINKILDPDIQQKLRRLIEPAFQNF
jgi:Fe-S cluster assembly protein SufD